MNTRSHTHQAHQSKPSTPARPRRWSVAFGAAVIGISVLLFPPTPAIAQHSEEIANLEKMKGEFVKEATELRSKANALAEEAKGAKGRFDKGTAELESLRSNLKQTKEENASDPEDKQNIAKMTKVLPGLENSVEKRKDLAEQADIEATDANKAAKAAEERVAAVTRDLAAVKAEGQQN